MYEKKTVLLTALEPVFNQHRLIVDRSVIDWDFKSNPDLLQKNASVYALLPNVSHVSRKRSCQT